MTRKDYQRIAECLRANLEANRKMAESTGSGEYWGAHGAISFVIENMADTLAEDNPRFDRVRFRKACGLDS